MHTKSQMEFQKLIVVKGLCQFPKTSSRKDLDFGGSLQYIFFCDALLLSLAVFESHQPGHLWLVEIHQSDNQKWNEILPGLCQTGISWLMDANAYGMKCLFWWVTFSHWNHLKMLYRGNLRKTHLGHRAVVPFFVRIPPELRLNVRLDGEICSAAISDLHRRFCQKILAQWLYLRYI